MDESTEAIPSEYSGTSTLSLVKKRDVLTYARPDATHVLLEGKILGDPVTIRLRVIDHKRFLLLSRGFNWIQERPLNR